MPRSEVGKQEFSRPKDNFLKNVSGKAWHLENTRVTHKWKGDPFGGFGMMEGTGRSHSAMLRRTTWKSLTGMAPEAGGTLKNQKN